MREFEVSNHAVERALQMALDPDDIRAAVMRPRSSFWSDRTDSEWRTRGKITACVVVNADGVLMVKTFLWAKASGWVADGEVGSYEGRDGELRNVRGVVKARKRNR
jgi:hypothetical protein